MNRLYMLLALVITVMAAACYKDNGNYDYNEINKINIVVPNDTVQVKQFDTLRISANIQQTLPGQLVYKWYYLNQLQYMKYELSGDKDLKSVIGAAPGNYPLYLQVTDVNTGVSAYHSFLMTVTSNLPEGWLVLYDTHPDSCDAALVLPSGQVLGNLYAQANNKHLAGAARAIVNYSAQWNRQYLFCLSDRTGAFINPLDFRVDMHFDSAFYAGNIPLSPVASYPNPGAWFIMDYLFNGKQMYSRVWQGPTGRPKFGAPIEGDYEAAPFLMGTPYESFGAYPSTIYDEKHHRFLYVPANKTVFATFPPDAGGVFDMNNMGNKTLRYAYNTPDGRATALFKKTDSDTLFLAKLDFTTQRANSDQLPPPVSIQKVDITKTPDFASADFYILSPDLPLLYYAKGNKCYKYDIAANSSSVIYTFPAGVNITAINMLDPQKFKPFPQAGRRFAIATMEGTEGVLYDFDVAPTGSFINNTFTKRYTGSFGRIASIYYKVPL